MAIVGFLLGPLFPAAVVAVSRLLPKHLHVSAIGFAAEDPSDIPRLRTRHVTEGYREGVAASKDQYLQEGFDEGFALRAEIGLLAGSILGVLEGIVHGLQPGTSQRTEVVEMLDRAEQDLKMEKLISEEFFEGDGNWKFEVGDGGSGEDFAFGDVAAAHPTLKAWKGTVRELGRQYGVEAAGHTIGQSALLAQFPHEQGTETATGEDLVGHLQREEIGIVTPDAELSHQHMHLFAGKGLM